LLAKTYEGKTVKTILIYTSKGACLFQLNCKRTT